jgi:histidinol-phosphate/aromatic aminotransferase/cobyric acid decarboxylase-like protein
MASTATHRGERLVGDEVWDPETQEVHGGQTWQRCGDAFVEDFSVTTNALGAPASALGAAREALSLVHHYPAADCAEALRALSAFLGGWPTDQLLLGNGASEFIDLVMRVATRAGGGVCRTGPYEAAYREYDRAARAAARRVCTWADTENGDALTLGEQVGVTVIVHPNSPTGDCASLEQLEAWIRTPSPVEAPDAVFVIDESFMPFQGPQWRAQSALQLVERYPSRVLVIQSWTKLWCCPGLRLGSIAGSKAWIRELKRLQTPWSCNTMAQAFCVAAAYDTAYMQSTWQLLPKWRERQEQLLKAFPLRWSVNENSPRWVPWVYVNCGSAEIAERATACAFRAGCPVRWCASFGRPTCLRLGVRAPEKQDILMSALRMEFASDGYEASS